MTTIRLSCTLCFMVRWAKQGFGHHDDLGRPVRILSPAGVAEWPLRGDARIEALARRIKVVIGMPRGLQILAGVVLFAMVIVFQALFTAWFQWLPRWTRFAFVVAAICVAGPLFRWIRARQHGPELARLLLEEGLCPVCAYNFHGLAAESDGLLRCPECGAGWRSNRILRVEPFANGSVCAPASTVLDVSSQMPGWTVKDARGMRCPLVHPRLRKEMRACEDGTRRERLLAARDEFAPSGRLIRWAVSAFFVFIAVLVVYLSCFVAPPAPSSPMGMGMYSVLGFTTLVFLGLSAWSLFGNFCYSVRRVKASMLRRGMCPSCADDLAVNEPDRDGCMVCLRCLSAWKREEAGVRRGSACRRASATPTVPEQERPEE